MLESNEHEDSGVFSQDPIINAIVEFNYMLDKKVTFLSYFCRYKDLYKMVCVNWSDHRKVKLGKGI